MSEIEEVTLEPRRLVGVRREVNVKELQPYFAEVLPKVMRWVSESGLTATSMPIAVWHAMDPSTGIADVQAGCFVAEDVHADGEITSASTPGGEALKVVHVGSYANMNVSWGRVYARAKELGRTTGIGFEIYVDDPAQVDESTLRTEIFLTLT